MNVLKFGDNKAILKIFIQNFKQFCTKLNLGTKFAEIIKLIFLI